MQVIENFKEKLRPRQENPEKEKDPEKQKMPERQKSLKKNIPCALIINAYASLLIPRLKSLKYNHDKIIKPKPDIHINIKSDEIDDYFNLPNKIYLNGLYQSRLI